ncbi:hypothetical protein D9757_010740 [Collybiopsis confluens]|uniref:Uncharacterized protein n=1 Tax=Collybiopsis confluens TaxID=2823264 RepID=A0A8H5LYD2_9AGAR|nr:hypothetical protein D9757_010740 [Collybiopsis confluens]
MASFSVTLGHLPNPFARQPDLRRKTVWLFRITICGLSIGAAVTGYIQNQLTRYFYSPLIYPLHETSRLPLINRRGADPVNTEGIPHHVQEVPYSLDSRSNSDPSSSSSAEHQAIDFIDLDLPRASIFSGAEHEARIFPGATSFAISGGVFNNFARDRDIQIVHSYGENQTIRNVYGKPATFITTTAASSQSSFDLGIQNEDSFPSMVEPLQTADDIDIDIDTELTRDPSTSKAEEAEAIFDVNISDVEDHVIDVSPHKISEWKFTASFNIPNAEIAEGGSSVEDKVPESTLSRTPDP